MRLIDADVAVENIEEWLNSVGTALIGKGLSYTGELMGCIEDTPTIDAITVVRCRDCKKHSSSVFYPDMFFCPEHGRYMNPDGYCSYGEREEGADNA